MSQLTACIGAEIFDGEKRHLQSALLVQGAHVLGIIPEADVPSESETVSLAGGLLTAGFVDLQVNGGGGRLLNNTPDVETIRKICDAHLQFGTTSLLPTLITDTNEVTDIAIGAIKKALAENVQGMIGLHLEGPHLSLSRKGAHDPAVIRKMESTDCDQLVALAADLPSLLLTVAPEAVSMPQIKALSDAGATVSLGHTDADFGTAIEASDNGATCVTHLFNAMSQLGNRAPGLVGAALEDGRYFAGLIADGIHVDPVSIRIAMRAKKGNGKIFLVTDAMATIGTDMREFTLNDRKIRRHNGRLNLSDGTLSGADLDMISAVQFMINEIKLDVDEALRMASLYPAQLLKRTSKIGRLGKGTNADFLHLDSSHNIETVWRGGIKQV